MLCNACIGQSFLVASLASEQAMWSFKGTTRAALDVVGVEAQLALLGVLLDGCLLLILHVDACLTFGHAKILRALCCGLLCMPCSS